MPGYLLSDDLIFTSRITATARAAGLDVQTARTVQQLGNLLAARTPQCLLIDLQNPGLSIGELIQGLPEPRPFVVAYGSHVDTARLRAASDAGCNLVLPRSKFVDELGKSLPVWFSRQTPSEPEA
jgi:DNA-binding response OmpR family regulator